MLLLFLRQMLELELLILSLTAGFSLMSSILVWWKWLRFRYWQLFFLALGIQLISMLAFLYLVSMSWLYLAGDVNSSAFLHRLGFVMGITGGIILFLVLTHPHLSMSMKKHLSFIVFSVVVFLVALIGNALTIEHEIIGTRLLIHYHPIALLPMTYVGAAIMYLLEKHVTEIRDLVEAHGITEMKPFNPKFWLFKFRAFFTFTAVFFFVARTFPDVGIPLATWTLFFFGGILYFSWALYTVPTVVLQIKTQSVSHHSG